METLEITVTLREKNQLTVPDRFVRRLGLKPGDRLILRFDGDEWAFHARALPQSYAGVAQGVYGTEEEVAAYIDGERASWNEDRDHA